MDDAPSRPVRRALTLTSGTWKKSCDVLFLVRDQSTGTAIRSGASPSLTAVKTLFLRKETFSCHVLTRVLRRCRDCAILLFHSPLAGAGVGSTASGAATTGCSSLMTLSSSRYP